MPKASIITHLFIKMLPWVLPFDYPGKISRIQDSPFPSKINTYSNYKIKKVSSERET